MEDEGKTCLLLNLMPAKNNIEIDHVQSLSDAREYILREKPALILMDNRLPEVMALTFTKTIH